MGEGADQGKKRASGTLTEPIPAFQTWKKALLLKPFGMGPCIVPGRRTLPRSVETVAETGAGMRDPARCAATAPVVPLSLCIFWTCVHHP